MQSNDYFDTYPFKYNSSWQTEHFVLFHATLRVFSKKYMWHIFSFNSISSLNDVFLSIMVILSITL